MTQMDLIPQFDGATYEPAHDFTRLAAQLERVKILMRFVGQRGTAPDAVKEVVV